MDPHLMEFITLAALAMSAWSFATTIKLLMDVAVLKNQSTATDQKYDKLDKKVDNITNMLADALEFRRRNDHHIG